ncbi:unnamed protein product, partial [Symbiodinium sp. KB8]
MSHARGAKEVPRCICTGILHKTHQTRERVLSAKAAKVQSKALNVWDAQVGSAAQPVQPRPVVYAWGFSGSGRLGLELDVDNKLEMLQIRERNKDRRLSRGSWGLGALLFRAVAAALLKLRGAMRRVSLLLLASSGPWHWSRPNILAALRPFAAMASTPITVLTTEDAVDKAAKIVEASKVLEAEATTEEVKSYYWWEGKVNFYPEWRVALKTAAPFSEVEEVVTRAHSYDLPMIIYDLPEPPAEPAYWKGVLAMGGEEAVRVAEKLVAKRIVACAQASATSLAVKTVARCKPLVEAQAGQSVRWTSIGGNAGYLNLNRQIQVRSVVMQVDANTVHCCVYPPMKVAERWKPKVRESNQSVAEDAAKLDEPSNTWSDCQRKLFEEKADCKLKALQDRERQVKRMCDVYLDYIYKMWDKPDSRSDPCEYELRHLRKELEVDYIRTLHAMNLDGSGEGPQMENAYWVKTDPEIKGKLCKFEELAWILQQQPVYMARLSSALRKGSLQEADTRTFRTMCERIYHDLFQPRTVHLFKSMLSLIIKSEMQQAKFLHDLFDPFKSHAASLFTQLSTHSAFVEGMVLPILNPQVETSLVSTIIRYTLLKRDGETPRVLGTEAPEHSHVTGVFTTHYPEYQELVKKANADKAAHPGKTSQKSYLYNFQNELADLQRACGKEPATPGHDSKDVHAGCITNFIEHFVTDLLAEDCAKDFRMLLVCAFKTMLNDCPAAKGFEESDPRVCTPLAALVLGNIIGSVLETVGQRRYSLVELSIRKQVLEMFSNMQRRKGRPKGDLEVDPNDVAEQLYDRVLFNIQALAKIFKRSVHRGVFRLQFTKGKGDEVLKEEPESLKVCEDIKDFTCHVLHKMLMKDLSKSELEELKSGRGRPDEAVADLAGELYSDLYMSHLTLEKTTVSMSSLEMLEMANLLWRQRQELIQSGDTQDMFRKTLEEVMRKRQVAAGKNFSHGSTTEEIQEYHPDGHLWLAGKHGEWHNLRPRARFLEYMRGPGYEPTFCNESKAPMPRCLTSEAQRKQKDYSLIRLFSIPEEEKGPKFTNQDGETVFVYEALEEILQILAGSAQEDPDLKYQINGSSLMELRNSFVKIQKAMMQDIKDGNASSRMRGTVMDLEDGKNMVGLLQNQVTSTSKELMAYIDAVVQNRFKHARYLEETKTRNNTILETRKNYEEILQEQVDTMKRVVRAAQNCDCPSLITLAAGQRSEKIAFLRIRRIKQRNRKQKPTPGQKAIDMMGMEEAEVKVQELRESFVPSQSFTLGQLESKGVLVRIHDGIASKTRKHICFNFRAANEGFDVQIFVPKAKLKEAEDRILK